MRPLTGFLLSLATGCAVGVVKTDDTEPPGIDLDSGDTGVVEAAGPGDPLPLPGCTQAGESDLGVDGVVDSTRETTWLDRTTDDGRTLVVSSNSWSASTGVSFRKEIAYDANLCVTSVEQVTSSEAPDSGTRTTSTCNSSGDQLESVNESLDGSTWSVVSTVDRTWTYRSDGLPEEVVIVTDFTDPGTQDTHIRAAYTYDTQGRPTRLTYFLGPGEEQQYYSIEYTWNEHDELDSQVIVLGEYFGSANGDVYFRQEATYDADGNQLTLDETDSSGRVDSTWRTFDAYGRTLTYGRKFESDGTDDGGTNTWDPEVRRQLSTTYTNDRDSTDNHTTVHSFDGDFPWTEVIVGTATDGGEDFQVTAVYTCPDEPTAARMMGDGPVPHRWTAFKDGLLDALPGGVPAVR